MFITAHCDLRKNASCTSKIDRMVLGGLVAALALVNYANGGVAAAQEIILELAGAKPAKPKAALIATQSVSCGTDAEACAECIDYPESSAACDACTGAACQCEGDACAVLTSKVVLSHPDPGGDNCGTCSPFRTEPITVVNQIEPLCDHCTFSAESGLLSLSMSNVHPAVERLALLVHSDAGPRPYYLWSGAAGTASRQLEITLEDATSGDAQLLYRSQVGSSSIWTLESISDR